MVEKRDSEFVYRTLRSKYGHEDMQLFSTVFNRRSVEEHPDILKFVFKGEKEEKSQVQELTISKVRNTELMKDTFFDGMIFFKQYSAEIESDSIPDAKWFWLIESLFYDEKWPWNNKNNDYNLAQIIPLFGRVDVVSQLERIINDLQFYNFAETYITFVWQVLKQLQELQRRAPTHAVMLCHVITPMLLGIKTGFLCHTAQTMMVRCSDLSKAKPINIDTDQHVRTLQQADEIQAAVTMADGNTHSITCMIPHNKAPMLMDVSSLEDLFCHPDHEILQFHFCVPGPIDPKAARMTLRLLNHYYGAKLEMFVNDVGSTLTRFKVMVPLVNLLEAVADDYYWYPVWVDRLPCAFPGVLQTYCCISQGFRPCWRCHPCGVCNYGRDAITA